MRTVAGDDITIIGDAVTTSKQRHQDFCDDRVVKLPVKSTATPHQRHRDTDVSDDFANDTLVDLMAKKIILLRKSLQSLLYMVELTTVFHHSDLSQILQDVEGQSNSFSLSLTVEGRNLTQRLSKPEKRKSNRLYLGSKLKGLMKMAWKSYEYKKRSEGDSDSERKDIEILKVDLSDPTKERTPSMNETVQEETSTGHENSPPNNEQPFDANSFHSASNQHYVDME
ncbi:hypothetical protein Tco_0351711 [Tanacetum coccineum]